MKKSSAFTLAETIITLFIVGLVVTASIPMFTSHKHSIYDEKGSIEPWNYCEDGKKTVGMCGINVVERDASTGDPKLDSDGLQIRDASFRNVAPNVLIGSNSCDDVKSGYDLTVYTNVQPENTSLFDMFKSDNRTMNIAGYNFTEETTNLYITPDNVPNGSNKSVIIGNDNRNTGATGNVVIGNGNEINTKDYNTVIGNSNTINSANTQPAVIFGEGNRVNNSITNPAATATLKIGTGLTKQNERLEIGNSLTQNEQLNIGDIITGNKTDGITIDNNIELRGTLAATEIALPSDERLKNIKGAYTKGLNEIMQVEPVVFKYKGQNSKNIGVIAQDVQKIFPEAVVKMPDGYLGVNSDPIFFAMLNSLKEVNEKANAEAQRQLELKKELEDIKSELASLSACESSGFLSRLKCFLYDTKMFFKSLLADIKSDKKVAKGLKMNSEVNNEKI